MPQTRVTCPGCKSRFEVSPDKAGKKVRCPECDEVVQVAPAAAAEGVSDAPRKAAPRRRDDDDRPRRRDRDDEDDVDVRRRGKVYKPCPRCGGRDARKVVWTWWGSFYGPAMFTHVKCLECGAEYNGRSGKPNTVAIVLFVAVPLFLILCIFGGCLGFALFAL